MLAARAALLFLLSGALTCVGAADARFAAVTPNRTLTFPSDFGSHPEFRTEWWYVTGWLTTQSGDELGFQITFFRVKPQPGNANPSAFSPQQLLIAHCAISDPKRGRLRQDQTIQRAGMGLAEAAEHDTNVWIDHWSLRRGAAAYQTLIDAEDFSLRLTLTPTQPPLLNGSSGFSRKGPQAESASYYYSIPHLAVGGTILRNAHGERVSGEAWLDHEWSSEYLDDDAIGWEWVGLNLEDGGALMAFRIRDAHGDTRWAGGTARSADGAVTPLAPAEVEFRAIRHWRSPRTGIDYPVQWQLRAGTTRIELTPLFDDQENDTRLSTGAIYWEGAVRASQGGRRVGRGYLELTGYGERLRLH